MRTGLHIPESAVIKTRICSGAAPGTSPVHNVAVVVDGVRTICIAVGIKCARRGFKTTVHDEVGYVLTDGIILIVTINT